MTAAIDMVELDREEGEITENSELEDISDSSIVTLCDSPFGKSTALIESRTRGPLREVSLSSVSDSSLLKDKILSPIQPPQGCRKPTVDVRNKRKRASISSDSDLNGKKLAKSGRFYSSVRKPSLPTKDEPKSERQLNVNKGRRRLSSSSRNRRSSYVSISSSDSDSSPERQTDRSYYRKLRDAVRINKSDLPNKSLRNRLKSLIGTQVSNDVGDQKKEISVLSSPKTSDLLAVNECPLDTPEIRLIDELLESVETDESKKDNDIIVDLTESFKGVSNEHANVESSSVFKSVPSQCSASDKGSAVEEEVEEDLSELRLIALKSALIKKKHLRLKKTVENSSDKDSKCTSLDISSSGERESENLHVQVSEDQSPKSGNLNANLDKVNAVEPATLSEVEEDEDILRAMLLTSIAKKITTENVIKPSPNIPKENLDEKVTAVKTKQPIQRLIIKVNSDSDSEIEEDTDEKQVEVNDSFDENLTKLLKQARANTEQKLSNDHTSDSVLKYLPKSQQLEYKKLKAKLQRLASNNSKTKSKRPPDTENASSKETILKRLNDLKMLINLAKTKHALNQQSKGFVNKNVKPSPPIKTVKKFSPPFPKSKKMLVVNKNRQNELSSLMNRVTAAKIERDKAQSEVKKLINELKAARSKLTSAHQAYSTLVEQLVKAKQSLEPYRSGKPNNKLGNHSKVPLLSSTPIRTTSKLPPSDNAKTGETKITLENLPNDKEPETLPTVEEKSALAIVSPKEDLKEKLENAEGAESSSKNKSGEIDQYVSPLDHLQSNGTTLVNPLTVMCPYDLFGVCKDPECTYQHCAP